MNKIQKPIARKNNIVMQSLEDETLIYDLENNKAFCLNETSTIVWQLCNGKHSGSEISDKMSKKMKTLVSEDLVFLALDQLHKDGLLENGDKIADHFSGLSRREVIKSLGFASVIALPVISSLVAPSPAMAQSQPVALAANGEACTPQANALCTSNNCLFTGIGGGSATGICCAAGATGANSPAYAICSSDPDAATFSTKCCSGNASVHGTQGCPNGGDTRYQCGPY